MECMLVLPACASHSASSSLAETASQPPLMVCCDSVVHSFEEEVNITFMPVRASVCIPYEVSIGY